MNFWKMKMRLWFTKLIFLNLSRMSVENSIKLPLKYDKNSKNADEYTVCGEI